ncbi:hypothetical protein ACPV4X_26240 [Vibrio owensii]|uniref:hypothetical protein n=1 Tax=Vibrio owensii TaxID=696485 RepID=UPI00406963A4
MKFKDLRQEKYREPSLIRDTSISAKTACINLKDLVGSSRQEGYKNWVESLNSLQKGNNFDILSNHGILSFEKFLLNATHDLPQVFEKQGSYYIAGGGKHRLTIAKCCGIKQAKVDVIVAK